MNKNHLNTIKCWAEDDRPREKLAFQGARNLSTAELMAILISSGNREETAVQLCQRIMQACHNDLRVLSRMSVNDLKKFKGIGEAKAVSLIAALELGKRRQSALPRKKVQVRTSADAYEYLRPVLSDLPHEEFWLLLLNRANKIMESERISIGGVSGTVADLKVIFKRSIDRLASSIILAHNHPSGNLRPSQADKNLTKKVVAGGKLLDIAVLDHLIITDEGYFSFADEHLL